MWVTVVSSVVVALAAALYFHANKCYRFFDEHGIKSVAPLPLIGSMWRSIFHRRHIVEDLRDVYSRFPDEKYVGIYEGITPTLVIRDLEMIKKITVKDFDHFVDHRNLFAREHNDGLITSSVLVLTGQKWRDMRGALSPAFTGSKMRMMLPLMTEVGEQLVQYLNGAAKNFGKGKLTEPMEMYELLSRVANDIIASCAFGLKVDSLEDKQNEFYTMGRLVTNFKTLTFVMVSFAPRLCRYLGISIFPNESTDFFRNLVSGAVKHRENNNIIRHDMIQLLMEAKRGTLSHSAQKSDENMGFATVEESTKTTVKRQWTEDELTAQAFIFFLAGFDSVSTALTFTMHELTINAEVQEKLRAEIDFSHTNNSHLTYEVIQRLKYMDMVISEVLRKYTAALMLDRECAKEYTLDPPHPGGKPFTIKEKTYIYIAVSAMHMDEKYFPEPEKFDPERFSDERKHTIQPFSYLPFGSGPRNCIGSRFALMEVKVLLYQLLLNFELVACEKTTNPIRLKPGFKLAVEKGSWIQFKTRKPPSNIAA